MKHFSLNVNDLSDAAVELIVLAIISKRKSICLKEGEIYLDLVEKRNPFWFDFPWLVPSNEKVLEELVKNRLLIPHDQKYDVVELDEKIRNDLIERDNERIFKNLPEPGIRIFKGVLGKNAVINCEYSSQIPMAKYRVYQRRTDGESSEFLSAGCGDTSDINRTILILQKNKLVEQWFLQHDPDSPTRGAMSFPPSKLKRIVWGPMFPDYLWVEGRVTKRGEQIAKLFNNPPQSES